MSGSRESGWCAAARTSGFELAHHNGFFTDNYRAEFETISKNCSIAETPTVYLCAQDRGEGNDHLADTPERLLGLINAPAAGDKGPLPEAELADLAGDRGTIMLPAGEPEP